MELKPAASLHCSCRPRLPGAASKNIRAVVVSSQLNLDNPTTITDTFFDCDIKSKAQRTIHSFTGLVQKNYNDPGSVRGTLF